VNDIEKSEWGGSEDMQEDLGQIQRNLWKTETSEERTE
jgi:hypothetical protein